METPFDVCANKIAQELLKCYFCDKFLSVPPIFGLKLDSICGRCKFTNKALDPEWTRQHLYESVAQYMIFPCSNVSYGCKTQLPWGKVEDHENTCPHKKLICPFINDDIFETEKCMWTGSGPRLNEHLESQHGDLIKKLPEFTFSEMKSSSIYLTKIMRQLMIVVVKFEPPGKFQCLVMINGTSTDCDAYRYQLELYDENRKNSLILRRSRLEDAVCFEENLMNSEKLLIVDLEVVKGLLKNPKSITGRFGIIKKSKREFHGLNPFQDMQFDENFVRELECPICKNYMMPPIQICSTGHSFCQNCKEQMDECPTCRHPFGNGRNYTLEKLTSCINYPCMYKDSGCSMAGSCEKIRQHELECSFTGAKCFLDCTNGAIINMMKHLQEKHSDHLIVAGEINIMDLSESEDVLRNYAICFGNDIFHLSVFYNGVDIKFTLQQFGVKECGYLYEVEIICSTECSEKVIYGKECQIVEGNAWEKCIELPCEILQRFISEEDLIFYKIHLKKSI